MRVRIFSVSILVTTLAVGGLPAFSADGEGRKMEMKKSLSLKVGSYRRMERTNPMIDRRHGHL